MQFSLQTVRYTVRYGPGFDHSVTTQYYPPYITVCPSANDVPQVDGSTETCWLAPFDPSDVDNAPIIKVPQAGFRT